MPKQLKDLVNLPKQSSLEDHVGHHILITRIEAFLSEQYGEGLGLTFYRCDKDGGPVDEGQAYECGTFAKNVLRALQPLTEDHPDFVWENPDGVVCEVSKAGQTIILE